MKVLLKNNWVVEGYRFKRSHLGVPVEIPEMFRDKLPPTARIVDDVEVVAKAPDAASLNDFDGERAAGEVYDRLLEEAYKADDANKQKRKK